MDTQIVRLFCLGDDLLKDCTRQDRQSLLSDVEGMIAAIVAMLSF